jgi:hypothetical protein
MSCSCLSCRGNTEEEACGGFGEFFHAKDYWTQEKAFDPLAQEAQQQQYKPTSEEELQLKVKLGIDKLQ